MSQDEKIKQLEEELSTIKKRNSFLENELREAKEKIESYETGDNSLYYSIQRKMSEMSKMLNSNKLDAIDITSKSDATFERIFKLLEKMEAISNASNSLASSLGIKAKEEKKPFTDKIATDRA